MNDKQQLQEMGLHLSEQQAKGIADAFAEIDYAWELPPTQEGGLCMAKQIEDLQARLQECAKGAAKMQEQRDAAYVMAGKSGLERDKFAQQLKAANQQIAAMAELLRRCKPYIDDQKDWGREYEKKLSTDIESALSGNLPDHVAGVGNMVPEGWQLIRIEHANDVAETVIEDHVVTEWDHRWQEISGYRCGYCSLSGNTCDDVINGEHDHDCVITKARSMLAAAPKPEQTK